MLTGRALIYIFVIRFNSHESNQSFRDSKSSFTQSTDSVIHQLMHTNEHILVIHQSRNRSSLPNHLLSEINLEILRLQS